MSSDQDQDFPWQNKADDNGDLPRQEVFIDEEHSQPRKASARKTRSKPKWTLSNVLNQSIDTRYEHQLDDFGPPLDTMELEQTGLARKLNGTANGVVNPLTEHLQDDDISEMMKGSVASQSSTDSWWSERKTMLRNFSNEYMYTAGCHGVARGMQKKGSLPRRLLWWAAVVAASSVLFYQCSLLIRQFLRNEFQVDVDFSFNRELAFPAVTFCNLNPLKQSTLVCSRFDTGCDQNASDPDPIVYNASLLDSIPEIIAAAPSLNLSQLDFSGSPITSQEYLQYGFLPRDMLISCTWNGQPCNALNFTVAPNPFYGNCFTINGDPSSPLLTNHPGPGAGLILELFVDPFEGVGGETSTSSGVRMSLHQPGVKPFPEEDGFSLSTGFATSIGVRQLEVSRLGDPYSNCTSQDANWLSLYPGYSYSRTACVQSCLAQAMFDTCGCVEIFLVGKPICLNTQGNATQAQCVARVRENYRVGRLDCDSCYNPCVDRIYLHTLSLAAWPAADYQYHFRAKVAAQNISTQYAAPEVFREYFLRAEIYFEELNYQRIVQQPAYALENLLADIGGQFGLWAGLSVLGFIEVFDFLGQFLLMLMGVIKRKFN